MKSEILFNLVEDLVLRSHESPYVKLKGAVNRIDNNYFDEIQRDCETLPTELQPELRDKVIDDFKRMISALLNDTLCEHIVAKVHNNTTVSVSDSDIQSLAGKLRTYADGLQKCVVDLSGPDGDIQALYEEAKERTIGERIMQSNKDDIIRFHHALQDNTVMHVRRLIDVEIGKFISRLADKFEHTN